MAFLVALGLATLAVLVVMALALARVGARLASTLAEFQREVEPMLEEIRSGADRASRRLERLQASREDPGPSGSVRR